MIRIKQRKRIETSAINSLSAKILSQYEERISAIGFSLHAYLLDNLSNIIEQPDEPANIIGFSYGPGYKSVICVIIPSKKGIKLGFNRGSQLPDPSKLLTGKGKVHKYVEIKSGKDILNPALKQLLAEATKAYQSRKK